MTATTITNADIMKMMSLLVLLPTVTFLQLGKEMMIILCYAVVMPGHVALLVVVG